MDGALHRVLHAVEDGCKILNFPGSHNGDIGIIEVSTPDGLSRPGEDEKGIYGTYQIMDEQTAREDHQHEQHVLQLRYDLILLTELGVKPSALTDELLQKASRVLGQISPAPGGLLIVHFPGSGSVVGKKILRYLGKISGEGTINCNSGLGEHILTLGKLILKGDHIIHKGLRIRKERLSPDHKL